MFLISSYVLTVLEAENGMYNISAMIIIFLSQVFNNKKKTTKNSFFFRLNFLFLYYLHIVLCCVYECMLYFSVFTLYKFYKVNFMGAHDRGLPFCLLPREQGPLLLAPSFFHPAAPCSLRAY